MTNELAPLSADELAELARLEAAAAAAPWIINTARSFYEEGKPMEPPEFYICQDGADIGIFDDVQDLATAKFTVAIRNAAPRLLRQLAAAERRASEAQGYLDLSNDAHSVVRRLLDENDVPSAAFIDDNVGNAIWQRNEARKERDAATERAAEMQAENGKLRKLTERFGYARVLHGGTGWHHWECRACKGTNESGLCNENNKVEVRHVEGCAMFAALAAGETAEKGEQG